jgi:hypothetical protein
VHMNGRSSRHGGSHVTSSPGNPGRFTRALFFDREIKRVTEIAWDQAVNDTANFWQSILWNALGRERAWQLYGIPEPVKEIGTGSLC